MKYKNRTLKVGLLLAFLFLFALGQSASAATKTANTGTHVNWAAITWSPAGAPTTADDVIIPDGTIIQALGANISIKSLTMNGDASLTTGANSLTLAATEIGNLTLNGTSSLTLSAVAGNLTIGDATYRGNIVMNDNSTLTNTAAATISLSGTWTKGDDATITFAAGANGPNLTFVGSTALSLPATVKTANSIVIDKTGSTVTLNDDMTINTSLLINAGTLIIGDNDITVTTTTTIDAGATFDGNSSDDVTVTRTFTTLATINGTLNSSGPKVVNNFLAAATISAANAGGSLNINHSETTITGNLTATNAGTINALGTDLTLSGAGTLFTNISLYTNSNTALTFTAAITSALPSTVTNLLSYTSTAASAITLSANLTIADDLTLTLGTLTANGFNIAVYGNYSGAGTLNVSGVSVAFYGAAVFTGSTFTATAATDVTFGGIGAITTFPPGVASLNSITLNRTGVTLALANIITVDNAITITSGTLDLNGAVNVVDLATTTTTIGANGTFVNDAQATVFLGTVQGAGTIIADGADDITFSGVYTFTGNFVTSTTTLLTFDTNASDVSLNSSITDLSTLTFDRAGQKITLNNNLTFTTAISAAEFVAGELDVNGYTLTFGGAYTNAAANAWTLSASNSSLVFVGAATFIAATTYNIDETTNLEFRAAPTMVANIDECKNLTVVGATAIELFEDLEVFGNLEVQAAGGSVDLSANGGFDLTVYGDISNLGTLDLTGQTLTLYGLLQGEGTYTTTNATNLVVKGTGSQLVLPSTFGDANVPPAAFALNSIEVDRTTGMKLNSNILLGGAATTDLIIKKGDLDLNGYVIVLATVTDAISETAGNTVINTGASGAANGYIETASANQTQLASSGIGVLSITAGSYTVRRYPITIPVPDVGLSTTRIYQISDAAPTAVTLQYDNTELYSNAADLKIYTSTSLAFTLNADRTLVNGTNRTVNENTPDGKGNLAYSSFRTGVTGVADVADGDFYALAGVPGDGGVLRIFAASSGNWGNASNWNPSGVPSKFDQVVIPNSTVYLNGNGNIYECKTLLLNHASATLLPTDNTINGDNVSLRVMGNITLQTPGAEILGVNGYGRLSMIIGDGVTAGVSSKITANNDYVPTSGIWIHNLTINMAEVTFETGAYEMRVSGNVNLMNNTYLDAETNTPVLVLYGGYGNQTINIPMSASANFQTIKLDNNAYVTTTSSFDMNEGFIIKNGSSFIANNGTISFASGIPWAVEDGGIFKLWNVEISEIANNDYEPTGIAYVQGNFTKSGASNFVPKTGTVIFSNISQREIVNASDEDELIFWNLQIAEGSSVVTSTSWQVSSEIDVKNNASLIADQGTISMVGGTPATKWIKNVSTHTLEFFNLDLAAGTTYTTDSWTIHGDLTSSGGSLVANNGTITFDNYAKRTIDNGGNATRLKFFKILITDGSELTTSSTALNGDFTITNNATYPSGAGIEVQGTGQFYVGDSSVVVGFASGVGVTSGNPKLITKSANGTLKFGRILILPIANNEVATTSDFEITGSGESAFGNLGAGAKFTATAGTVTFSGTDPEIQSVSPAVTKFYSILTTGATALTFPATPNDNQEIYISGNITINGTSSFIFGDDLNKVILDGSTQQIISGNTITIDPVQFSKLIINKSNNSEVLLQIPVIAGNDDAHELTLTNGIINLGNQTLTIGAGVISRHNGVINGSSGTLLVNTVTDPIWLADYFFTVNGIPTLYNLTVATAHETANDLTVNGTLLLQADLTIANGTSEANPKLLTLNGNLSRNGGFINGDAKLSRLVLAGPGTVTNGLSNAYFTGGAATTVQLEVARQETLGGNLNIVDDSYLRINTGINDFDLGTNKLTFNSTANPSFITMISGGIKAGTGSAVDLTDAISYIPASMFRNDECYNLTYGADLTLGGNLTVLGTLNFVAPGFDIITGDNILTFGPSATLPAFTDAVHVVGNLRRYVKNIPPTVFNIGGDGTANYYTPVTLQFANSVLGQAVLIKPTYANPTNDRGGEPKNAVLAYFEIIPEGTAPVDSLKAIFQWDNTVDGETTPSNNASFPAKWTGSSWYDYRNKLNSFIVSPTRVITMTSFPIANPAALKGVWAIFNASANTTEAKDRAISTERNKLVITKVEPNPVKFDLPFKTTVQLQNRFGQPIVVSEAFELQIDVMQGEAQFPNGDASVVGIIQPGHSEVTISGMTLGNAGTVGANHILRADTTGGSVNWQAGISEPFAVIPMSPAAQAKSIIFSNVKPTSFSIAWTNGTVNKNLVVIKADTLLKENEYPVNATTYLANTIYGAGSTFGDAVVVFNGANPTPNTLDITGLAPNTTYYVYVFTYDGGEGYESYRTTAAAGNPNLKATTGSYDDDVAYGINNTRTLSKGIGTNTPVRGTVKSDTDEDWFNFTMTSASPNLRIKIYNLPENYNIELYDQTGKRVRRSYLQNRYVDAFIMNELTAGTYTVRVYGYNGVYDTVNPYTLQVTTSSSEIFSVTP